MGGRHGLHAAGTFTVCIRIAERGQITCIRLGRDPFCLLIAVCLCQPLPAAGGAVEGHLPSVLSLILSGTMLRTSEIKTMTTACAQTNDRITTPQKSGLQSIGSPSAFGACYCWLLIRRCRRRRPVLQPAARMRRKPWRTRAADLVRLLRVMAALKVGLALGATAAVLWRFGTAVSPGVVCGIRRPHAARWERVRR